MRAASGWWRCSIDSGPVHRCFRPERAR
jgi:hypothetical protein